VLDELAAVFAAGANATDAQAAAAKSAEPPAEQPSAPAAVDKQLSAAEGSAASAAREGSAAREPKTPAPEWESWPQATWTVPSAQPTAPPLAQLLEFPVEVADGRRLAISWPIGAEPRHVARVFATAHGLPVDDVEEIERFVRKAEALVRLQSDLALRTMASQSAKPAVAEPAAAEPAAAEPAAAEPAAAEPAAAAEALAAAARTSFFERAHAEAVAAAAAAAAETRALDALRAMGFAQDEALLAEVIAKNGGDMLMCVADLTALADWETMLSDLEAMGFEDEQKNKAALVSSKGDVKSAIRQLVKGAQQPASAPARM
jgi:hypothetical protein